MENKAGALIKNVASLLRAADDATSRNEFRRAGEYLDDAKYQLEQYEAMTGQRRDKVVQLQRPIE